MSQTASPSVTVRILRPVMDQRAEHRLFGMEDVPPRSRLYGLAPREVGTRWSESLTSYLTRLAWRYRVHPQVLIAQELPPRLAPRQLPASHWGQHRKFNDNETLALESATILEALTTRTDIHLLTLQTWVGDFPLYGALRERPAWCPVCYALWKERGVPLYEPLVWTLKMIQICPQHQSWLDDRCPACHRGQTFLRRDSLPGHCIRCKTWLGRTAPSMQDQQANTTLRDWQEWVLLALDELRTEFVSTGRLA